MKNTYALGAAAIAGVLLFGGCSAATTTPVNPGTGTSGSAAAPTTDAAPVAGGTVDTNTLIKQISDGASTVKTSTTTIEMSITADGKPTTTKMIYAMDQSQAGHLKAHMTMGDGAIQIVTDGDDFYMQMAGTWFKMTKAQMEKSGTSMPDVEDQAATLKKLGTSIQKVVLVGDDTVDGTATKHYTLTLDGSAIAELGSGATAAAVATPGETFPYDLWVDAAGVTRKFAIEMPSGATAITMTGTISKINEAVTIEVPANAQELPG